MNRALAGALARDPAERFASVGDLSRALEQDERPRHRIAYASAVALTALALVVFVALRERTTGIPAVQFTQLTNFTDAVTSPALSPDGRTIAFLRGGGTFGQSASIAQLYVKQLPDGEAVQLTNTSPGKATPVFSPDGARIAFTSSENNFRWATEIVAANGGNVTELLPNASGLTWIDDGHVLFSENRKGMHMGIRSATIARGDVRDVYFPPNDMGMAHRSAVSPDRKWVLLAEMDHGVWTPCRIVPLDGSSRGRQVGPANGQCTYAAWAPRGRWMYFTANAGGQYHIWRQRFPDGKPEQLTHGPTEEEGIAVAPDGRSLITAAGVRLNSIAQLDSTGDRKISVEGFATMPQASADGSRVYYIAATGAARGASNIGHLVAVTLASGAREQLLPDHLIAHFDLSSDDRTIVFTSASDDSAKQGIWVAPLDRSAAPRRVYAGEVERALFDPAGNIYFVVTEGSSRFLHRLRARDYVDERIYPEPVFHMFSISPDGEWVVGLVPYLQGQGTRQVAISTRGLPAQVLCPFCSGGGGPARVYAPAISWTRDGHLMLVSGQYVSKQALDGPPVTVAVPVIPGHALPKVPSGGFTSLEDYQKLPGARTIQRPNVLPGASPAQLFSYESTAIRNLYRVQLR